MASFGRHEGKVYGIIQPETLLPEHVVPRNPHRLSDQPLYNELQDRRYGGDSRTYILIRSSAGKIP